MTVVLLSDDLDGEWRDGVLVASTRRRLWWDDQTGAVTAQTDDEPVVTVTGLAKRDILERAVRDLTKIDIHQQARTALVNNAAFLAIPTPTAAQVRDQVQDLTRQNQRIIKLLLALDGARDLLDPGA